MASAAQLNRRVTIQRLTGGQDATGAPIQEWVNVVPTDDGKIWAAIEDMKSRQFIAAASEQTAVITKITIRYRDGITKDMRVLHGADIYDIKAVLGQDRHWLELMCERGVNNG